jgi:vitamin B12 transporter
MALFSVLVAVKASAEDQEEFFEILGRQDLETTAGRFPRTLSHTPENVSVVTISDIEAINAHTLADVLAIIPGIQIENQTGSASVAMSLIQGSNFGHVLVLLDNIPINNLSDNYPDIGLIPANIIERVEVVKGAASSAWGQALGGVINVITKRPNTDRKFGGQVSQTYGERGTTDTKGELSGESAGVGYFVSGGYFTSRGFHPNTGVHTSNAYSKFSYLLPSKGEIKVSLYHTQAGRGDCDYLPWDIRFNDEAKRTIVAATFYKAITNNFALELTAHHSVNLYGSEVLQLSNDQRLQAINIDERVVGGNAKLIWKTGDNSLVAGIDYDHVSMVSSDTLVNADILDRKADRYGLYLNDSLQFGNLSLSAGVRYDETDTSGNQISPSAGVTWQVGHETTLRAYTAWGYSLPALTLDRGTEKVWTSQVGIESSGIPYIWVKGTLFRNETKDVSSRDPQTGNLYLGEFVKEGVETEIKSAPVFNTSLSAGYTFINAFKNGSGETLRDIPKHTLHMSARYDDYNLISGMVSARYIDWNADAVHNGSYGGVILDIFATVTPFGRGELVPELFFSVRNVFDAKQYLDEIYKNSGRWLEGGVRFRF